MDSQNMRYHGSKRRCIYLRFAHIHTVILFYFIELTMLLSASFTCLDACCHGLRLPVFNKETTYLLTYLMRSSSRWRCQHSSSATRTQPTPEFHQTCRTWVSDWPPVLSPLLMTPLQAKSLPCVVSRSRWNDDDFSHIQTVIDRLLLSSQLSDVNR